MKAKPGIVIYANLSEFGCFFFSTGCFFLLLTFTFINSLSWHSCVLTPVQNFPALICKQLETASDSRRLHFGIADCCML